MESGSTPLPSCGTWPLHVVNESDDEAVDVIDDEHRAVDHRAVAYCSSRRPSYAGTVTADRSRTENVRP